MLFYPISALINAVTSTIVGIIAITKSPKSRLHRSFSYFAFSVAFWSYCYFIWQITKDANAALFWCRALMAFAIFIPAAFFHFSVTLIKQREKYLTKIIFWYGVSIIFFILDFTPLFITDVRPRLFFPFWPTAGIAYTPFLAMFIGLTIYSHVLMFKNWKGFSSAWRNQIKFVSLGTAIGFLGGTTNYPLWYDIKILPIGNILVSVYVFLVFYAIIRFRLMDINIALTRAGIFTVVYTLVLGIPFWIGHITKAWFPATLFAVTLATSGPFIYQYLRRQAEDRLLKDQRRYQKALRELSKTMTRIRELDKLLKVIVLTVVDTVKVSYAGIYLKDEEYKSYRLKHYFPKVEEGGFPELIPLDSPMIKSLQAQKRPLTQEEIGGSAGFSLDSGLIIPCFMEDELLGFLIMGAKPKHQMYSSDDILAFETLSYSTSLAIENCIFWKEIEDRHRKARLQEMDTYSYSLAHEIDNPMQIIIGQTELLRKYLLKEANVTEERQQELSDSFDFILEAARRVSGMVKAIRDFGQKTTGEFKPLDIEDVVESFARLYHPEFKDKIVLFEKTSSLQNPVFVRGEKPELMQALVILANNSLHAMTGLKEKKASLKLELVNHEHVRVSFSDNGYGIKRENLEIIFAPFTTTKASTEGTGMGLYNAKKIIERHKGKIWAESEGPGKGATFVIELPVAKDIKPEELEDKNKGKRVF